MHAGTGTHLHDMVCRPDGVLVVLNYDHGIADVAQVLQGGDHLRVVFRMQADARLVEDVEHPHQSRADLRREANAL